MLVDEVAYNDRTPLGVQHRNVDSTPTESDRCGDRILPTSGSYGALNPKSKIQNPKSASPSLVGLSS